LLGSWILPTNLQSRICTGRGEEDGTLSRMVNTEKGREGCGEEKEVRKERREWRGQRERRGQRSEWREGTVINKSIG
jgi:hypothetical protein